MRRGDVEAGEQRDGAVRSAQVQADAEGGGRPVLAVIKRRAMAEMAISDGDERVGLDRQSERHHAHVGEDAVEHLREQERHQDDVAEERATRCSAPYFRNRGSEKGSWICVPVLPHRPSEDIRQPACRA